MPALPTIRCIVLTGFMGAGKSTIGALLSQALGWRFVDSDAAVEARTGCTVAQIFAEQGEAVFRGLEAETVRFHIGEGRDTEGLVLALGGGAIENERTREILAGAGQGSGEMRMVFLDAPLDLMVARCIAQPQAADRPVLADKVRLSQRFSARLPHYRRAHLTIATADLNPEAVVERILLELGLGEHAEKSLHSR